MTWRDFEYVIALAEEDHIGRAAERCHVSQPTLSTQLAKLEDLLGVTLFERTRRRVAITPAGAEIVVACRRTLKSAREVREIARAHRDPLADRRTARTVRLVYRRGFPRQTAIVAVAKAIGKGAG